MKNNIADPIYISEKTPTVWTKIIVGAIILALICCLLFIQVTDPLWKGIFRLLAFGGFALLVLAFFQKRGPNHRIELLIDNDRLIINYYQDEAKVQEEFFEIETIKQINQVSNPMVWGIIPVSECAKINITFTDTTNSLSLFRIAGKDLMISSQDAQQTIDYLESITS